ncbi:MAG: hypothetical protein CL902_00970 [Dehalococcoidia bacterium]|nr:hypothetical protein [Dehalococcoidia bacterium]
MASDKEQQALQKMSGADLAPLIVYVARSGRAEPLCRSVVATYGNNPDVFFQDVKLLGRGNIPQWLRGVPCVVVRETRQVATGTDECMATIADALASIPRSATGMGGGMAAGGIPQTMAAFEDGNAIPIGVASGFHDTFTEAPSEERNAQGELPDSLKPINDNRGEKLPESAVLAYMQRRQENIVR